jgi:hypothetical protein
MPIATILMVATAVTTRVASNYHAKEPSRNRSILFSFQAFNIDVPDSTKSRKPSRVVFSVPRNFFLSEYRCDEIESACRSSILVQDVIVEPVRQSEAASYHEMQKFSVLKRRSHPRPSFFIGTKICGRNQRG